jgi:hypothetical protein
MIKPYQPIMAMEKTMMMRITLLLVVALLGGADLSVAQEKVEHEASRR